MVLGNKKAYPEICHRILKDLEDNLPAHLTYHSLYHTIDVANVCNSFIEHFKIDEGMAKLLRIAAVCHDYGYIVSPINHEERSIIAIEPYLKNILTADEINIVNGLIRATKVPQQPKTIYEEIIADADLDYLGREDYDQLSAKLYQEFIYYDFVSDQKEWLNLQIKFLEKHHYHTKYAHTHREVFKAQKLNELKAALLAENT
ncbi:HD domain-containing protein [Flavobacteriaceae bacterium KMM 6898]|nr:HD domain-containing protein [Flavobacteriaceae bacterium KMM 6898]